MRVVIIGWIYFIVTHYLNLIKTKKYKTQSKLALIVDFVFYFSILAGNILIWLKKTDGISESVISILVLVSLLTKAINYIRQKKNKDI